MATLRSGSDRLNAFRKEEICLEWSNMNHARVMRSRYAQFRGMHGVGSYVNNEWRLAKIGYWIEYACGVKSETINLDRRVALRCAWVSFLSEEIFCCILQVSLECASPISWYNTPTGYGSNSL
jgi:hypothetical protein